MSVAPVDPGGLADSLLPFGHSLTLPAEAYTAPEVLAWERRHLFAGSWVCAGRADELFAGGAGEVSAGSADELFAGGAGEVSAGRASEVSVGRADELSAGGASELSAGRAGEVSAGTQCAVSVGGVGVLLTRDNGLVRGFGNVCRHRGHELLPAGHGVDRPAVVCPYHGWAYRLDGSLATAPGMRGVPGFDRAGHGLVEVPVAEWGGWVFVNAGGGAPAFTEHLGALAELIEPYQPQTLRAAHTHRYTVAANWKVIVENYHECYHCPLIHPELCRVSPPTSGDNWDLPGAWVGGSMDLRDHADTMSLDGRSLGRFIPGAPRGTVRYVGLFPNLLISAHPDYVMTHRLTPSAPDRTEVECRWHVPEGVADAAYAVEFWDVTNREDWAACESVQRGMSSPHYRPGPLAAGEDAVYQWITLVARRYLAGGSP